MADSGTLDHERAIRTIEVLELNDRDYLVAARKTAFQSYRALLADYGRQTDPGAKHARLNAIHDSSHPSVWWEMKRQQEHWEELANLYADAPELLDS